LLRGAAREAGLGRGGLEIRQRSEGQEKALPHRGLVDTGEMDRQSRTESLKKSPGNGGEVGRRRATEIARGINGAIDRETAREETDL
jgi:hypothetical protein